MKKLLILSLIALIPSLIFGSTATATVGGTLKVYQTVSVATIADMIFPAQFAGPASNLTNINGGAPATGIPNVVGSTQGRAGRADVTGTGGTVYNAVIATPMVLSNGGNTLSAALTLWGEPTYSTGINLAIPGSGNGQTSPIYVKGVIASGNMVAGTYTGSAVLTITYN